MKPNSDNKDVLNNIEWQVFREALSKWRKDFDGKVNPQFKLDATYSLEDKIDRIFTNKMKEHSI